MTAKLPPVKEKIEVVLSPKLVFPAGFEKAFGFLQIDECGEEVKNDPSREVTMFGLTVKQLKEWKADEGKVEREDAKHLLYLNLWVPALCDTYPPGLDYFVFDLSYRFEVARAIDWLYLSAGLAGRVTERVLEEKMKEKTPRDFIVTMDSFARRRMQVDPAWNNCKHWWTNRQNRARDRAVKLARDNSYGG